MTESIRARVNGRVRVAVVFGGSSSEHAVSCLTAAGVVKALDPDRYDVVGIGITRAGRWVLVEPPVIAAMAVHDGKLPELIDGKDNIGYQGQYTDLQRDNIDSCSSRLRHRRRKVPRRVPP